MYLDGGIRDPPLDRLAIRQSLTEGDTLLRVLHHHVECATGHSNAPGTDLQAPHRQPQLHRRETFALLAE